MGYCIASAAADVAAGSAATGGVGGSIDGGADKAHAQSVNSIAASAACGRYEHGDSESADKLVDASSWEGHSPV